MGRLATGGRWARLLQGAKKARSDLVDRVGRVAGRSSQKTSKMGDRFELLAAAAQLDE
jgi:hypothetical protein